MRHIVSPFEIPSSWRKFRTIDYGLDRLACLWIALAPSGESFVYREYCESGLPISRAAAAILARTPPSESIYATLAPPDMWHRTQETGKTKAELFAEFGVDATVQGGQTQNPSTNDFIDAFKGINAEKVLPRISSPALVRSITPTYPATEVSFKSTINSLQRVGRTAFIT